MSAKRVVGMTRAKKKGSFWAALLWSDLDIRPATRGLLIAQMVYCLFAPNPPSTAPSVKFALNSPSTATGCLIDVGRGRCRMS